jgi:hypothetical protein
MWFGDVVLAMWLEITRVSSTLRAMRTCAKMRCDAEPVATVSLRYAEREVAIGVLLEERDRNLLDLCREHVERLSPPVGWTVRDARVVTVPDTEPALAV